MNFDDICRYCQTHAEEKVHWCSPESCEYISRVAKHVGRFLVPQVAQAALFSQLGKEQDDLKLEVEEPLVYIIVVVQISNE